VAHNVLYLVCVIGVAAIALLSEMSVRVRHAKGMREITQDRDSMVQEIDDATKRICDALVPSSGSPAPDVEPTPPVEHLTEEQADRRAEKWFPQLQARLASTGLNQIHLGMLEMITLKPRVFRKSIMNSLVQQGLAVWGESERWIRLKGELTEEQFRAALPTRPDRAEGDEQG